jgi:hypothetical protein
LPSTLTVSTGAVRWLVPFAIVIAVLSGQAWADVTNVHTTFGEDPTRSVVVSWRTDATAIDSAVHYGSTAAYGVTASGSAIASGGGTIHHVPLNGLSPGQTYHFKCGDNSGWSPDSTFRTAPVAPASFSFAVVGDVQGRTFSTKWQNCSTWLAGRELPFWIPLGDIVDAGESQAQWDAFYTSGDELLRSCVVMPVIGNHEMLTDPLTAAQWPGLYLDQFELPDNGDATCQECWYAFDVGDALFVILNSNFNETVFPGARSRQTTWLQNKLSTATQEWVFVFLHNPIYSSGGGHGGEDMLPTWNALFEENRVTAVFSGHTHYFEAVVPIYDGQQVASYADGTLYYNAAGVSYNNVATGEWFTANRQPEEYMSLVCIVTVQADSVVVTTYDFSDGSELDRITIPSRADYIFVDGFESGSTSAWASP